MDSNAVLGNLLGHIISGAGPYTLSEPVEDTAKDDPNTYNAYQVVRYDTEGNNPHVVGIAYYATMAVELVEQYQHDADRLLDGRYQYRVEVKKMPERRKASTDRRSPVPT